MKKHFLALAISLLSSTAFAQDVVAVNQDVAQEEQIKELQRRLEMAESRPQIVVQQQQQQQVAPVVVEPRYVQVFNPSLLTLAEKDRLLALQDMRLRLGGPIALTVISAIFTASMVVNAVDVCMEYENEDGYLVRDNNCEAKSAGFAVGAAAFATATVFSGLWLAKRAKLRRESNRLIRKATVWVPSHQAVGVQVQSSF